MVERVKDVVTCMAPQCPSLFLPLPTSSKYGWLGNLHGSSPNLEQGWGWGWDDHRTEHESFAVATHPLAWTLTHPAPA